MTYITNRKVVVQPQPTKNKKIMLFENRVLSLQELAASQFTQYLQ